ncbi:hypothetical protein TRAPUB_7041 [Trametes pubescens]|uniref:Uncharacterized protein n=1 Tax=Trametes pubescens TaxID=154538 RepID=A0A1M2V4H0_TRAPU|nr:hypothetical protein TRAPUB_7041 [Trametes pubescens]
MAGPPLVFMTSLSHVHQKDEKHNRILKEDVDRFIEHVIEQIGVFPQDSPYPMLSTIFEGAARKHRDRSTYAHAISTWFEHQQDVRKAQLEDDRKQRFETIIVRLRNAGWDKEVDFLSAEELYAMSMLPVVRQSSKLTEGAWQKVLSTLDKFLNDTRAKRIERELRDTLRARFGLVEDALRAHYVTLPRRAYMDCRPQYIDLAFMPECRALLDVPVTETVTAEQVATVIPVLATRWQTEWKTRFTDYIRPYLGDIAPDADPLELAIASFGCDMECRATLSSMRYPNLLVHNCVRSVRRLREELEREDVYTRTAKTLTWSSQQWQAYEAKTQSMFAVSSPFCIALPPATRVPVRAQLQRVDSMRRVVSALGLDPARATFDDLDRCHDVWLQCVTCETRDRTRPRVMLRWEGATDHDTGHCNQMGDPEWRRADAEDMAQVHAAQAQTTWQRRTLQYFQAEQTWCCALCPMFNAKGRGAMENHLHEKHGIADAEEDKQDGVMYVHPSESRSVRPDRSIVLYPCVEPQTVQATEDTAGQ